MGWLRTVEVGRYGETVVNFGEVLVSPIFEGYGMSWAVVRSSSVAASTATDYWIGVSDMSCL